MKQRTFSARCEPASSSNELRNQSETICPQRRHLVCGLINIETRPSPAQPFCVRAGSRARARAGSRAEAGAGRRPNPASWPGDPARQIHGHHLAGRYLFEPIRSARPQKAASGCVATISGAVVVVTQQQHKSLAARQLAAYWRQYILRAAALLSAKTKQTERRQGKQANTDQPRT